MDAAAGPTEVASSAPMMRATREINVAGVLFLFMVAPVGGPDFASETCAPGSGAEGVKITGRCPAIAHRATGQQNTGELASRLGDSPVGG